MADAKVHIKAAMGVHTGPTKKWYSVYLVKCLLDNKPVLVKVITRYGGYSKDGVYAEIGGADGTWSETISKKRKTRGGHCYEFKHYEHTFHASEYSTADDHYRSLRSSQAEVATLGATSEGAGLFSSLADFLAKHPGSSKTVEEALEDELMILIGKTEYDGDESAWA